MKDTRFQLVQIHQCNIWLRLMMQHELSTRQSLFALHTSLSPRQSNKPIKQPITYLISLPINTIWTWSIITTFHLATKRLVLPGKTTVLLQTTSDSSEYTITDTTSNKIITTGRVNVLKWVSNTTSWYGKKRGTWWLKNINENDDLWKSSGKNIIPTALVMLQAGLRNGKRQFVAMETITMADTLVYALVYKLFSSNEIDQNAYENTIPQVIHWYQRMQQLLLKTLLPSQQSTITIQCHRSISVQHHMPVGCMQPVVLEWCELASFKLLKEQEQKEKESAPVRKWDKGGQNHLRSKGKSKRVQSALVDVQLKLETSDLFLKCIPCALNTNTVTKCCDWNILPFSVDPKSMMTGKDQRGRDASVKINKKRAQVQSMLSIILPLIKDGDVAVEFAAGSGYIGLVLAALRPKVKVILMDQNPVSMQYAQSRAIKGNLLNVECVVGDIRDFVVEGGYQIGFALHACGAASDYCLDHCIQNNAAYVLAPCCAGFMQNTLLSKEGETTTVPTSSIVRKAGITRDEYILLTAGADHSNHPEQAGNGRKAMAVLDFDRNMRAEELKGYTTKYYQMVPNSGAKNQILVGYIGKGREGGGGGNGGNGGDNGGGSSDNAVVVETKIEDKTTSITTTVEETTIENETKKIKKKKGCSIQ